VLSLDVILCSAKQQRYQHRNDEKKGIGTTMTQKKAPAQQLRRKVPAQQIKFHQSTEGFCESRHNNARR